jgi:hypothetical protein
MRAALAEVTANYESTLAVNKELKQNMMDEASWGQGQKSKPFHDRSTTVPATIPETIPSTVPAQTYSSQLDRQLSQLWSSPQDHSGQHTPHRDSSRALS